MHSCWNWLKYYIKIWTFFLSAALLYCSGGIRNYFLYIATIYLLTDDIKPFCQNDWSVRTWEPWLYPKPGQYFSRKCILMPIFWLVFRKDLMLVGKSQRYFSIFGLGFEYFLKTITLLETAFLSTIFHRNL